MGLGVLSSDKCLCNPLLHGDRAAPVVLEIGIVVDRRGVR
jgi:hypothetical protein